MGEEHPIDAIEKKNAFVSMGAMAVLAYRGALEEILGERAKPTAEDEELAWKAAGAVITGLARAGSADESDEST